MRSNSTILGILFVFGVSCAHAQWLNYRDSRTPRGKDGKPNLTAPVLRVNGKPDLSGVWQAERAPVSDYKSFLGDEFVNVQVDLGDVTRHMMDVFWGTKPENEPLTPEGAAIVQRRAKDPTGFPSTRCLPAGLPALLFIYDFKVIQTPQEIIMLSETGDPARQIYMDGRGLPKDPDPAWVGHSVGKWDGDTLVVESTGFNENSWLDAFGHPRSESMRITERYRRRDFGHMDLDITFDDPKYYTRSFSLKTSLHLLPDSDVLEFVCAENEKDRTHYRQ